jgi:tRNA pseudouridine13 synthase
MDLPFAHGIPPAGALLRRTPEDFEVEEQLGYGPDGEGEHLWLWVEKRGLNTEQVARQLARLAHVKQAEVGYAGLKDRHALTRQWFSLPFRNGDREAAQWSGEGWRVLHADRARRKLRRGGLRGNRFVITLREVRGERGVIEARLQDIAARGVPNYFGEQRFGHDNLARAEAMMRGELRVPDRHLRGLYLSSLRSALFNAVLAYRVRDGSWVHALGGESLNLDGSRSFFVADVIDEAIAARLCRGDIHPTGPLWGRGEPPSRGDALALEQAAVSVCPDLWREACIAAGMEQERRSLRLLPKQSTWQWLSGDVLRLEFSLPAGAYATVVVRELLSFQAGLAL